LNHFVDAWLEGLAQQPGNALADEYYDMHEKVQQAVASPRYRVPHEKFRLFISAESVKSTGFSFGCLWNKCIRINCTHAGLGIKTEYLKMSNTILRGRSLEEKNMDNLSTVLRRAFLVHLIFQRLSLLGASRWRFNYEFDLGDMVFSKERIVERLLSHQGSMPHTQLQRSLQDCCYMLSHLVHGARIQDVWDLGVAQHVASRLLRFDAQYHSDRRRQASDTPSPPPSTLEERLEQFYRIHSPDMVEEAHEAAHMFGDDEKSLQDMLIKKYGVGLPSTQLEGGGFERVESSSGAEVDLLIHDIESTLVSHEGVAEDGSCFKHHLDTLVTERLSHLGLASGGSRETYVSGQLDEIRDKTEAIERCLPARLIPLQSLEALAARQYQQGNACLDDTFGMALVHVILNECMVLNRCCTAVHQSVRRIDMALLRTSVLGGDKAHALACAQCLLVGRVPEEWTQCAYPSTKTLAGWLRDLADVRLPQALSWATKAAHSPAAFGCCFDLSSLCCPQAFVGALVLSSGKDRAASSLKNADETSRESRIQSSSSAPAGLAASAEVGDTDLAKMGSAHLTLSASVTDITDLAEVPDRLQSETGVCYVSGLHLHGASWLARPKEGDGHAHGRFVQRPLQALLPIVALRASSVEPTIQCLVPVYQLRRRAGTMVAIFDFTVPVGSDSAWSAAASLILEDSPIH